jgi:uncharacterized protein YkwD
VHLRRAFALCIAVASGFALVPAAAAGAEPTSLKLIDQVNEVRAQHGLRALRPSKSLERSSFAYAGHLMRTGRFAHARRIHASSRFRSLGEALAYHSGRSLRQAKIVRMWLASPGHRALLLSRSFRWVGAGHARGRFGGGPATIWVLHLGRR